jgi:hypothetical protein
LRSSSPLSPLPFSFLTLRSPQNSLPHSLSNLLSSTSLHSPLKKRKVASPEPKPKPKPKAKPKPAPKPRGGKAAAATKGKGKTREEATVDEMEQEEDGTDEEQEFGKLFGLK